MKKSIKILGALALFFALTIAVFAFKAEKKSRAMQYWEYSGSGSTTDQLNYNLVSGPSCASGTNVVCTILATEDSNNLGFPLISGQPVETRIINKDESSGDVFVRN